MGDNRLLHIYNRNEMFIYTIDIWTRFEIDHAVIVCAMSRLWNCYQRELWAGKTSSNYRLISCTCERHKFISSISSSALNIWGDREGELWISYRVNWNRKPLHYRRNQSNSQKIRKRNLLSVMVANVMNGDVIKNYLIFRLDYCIRVDGSFHNWTGTLCQQN